MFHITPPEVHNVLSKNILAPCRPIKLIVHLCPGNEKTCKLHLLYEQWCSANELWKQSSLVLRMKKAVNSKTRGARRWMTKKDIEARYDAEVAAEIIEAKSKPEMEGILWKPHPDLPGPGGHEVIPMLG